MYFKHRILENLVGMARNYHKLPGTLPARRVPAMRLEFARRNGKGSRRWPRLRKKRLGSGPRSPLGCWMVLHNCRLHEPFSTAIRHGRDPWQTPRYFRNLENKLAQVRRR